MSQVRGNLRDRARPIVAPYYGFVNLKHERVISKNKKLYNLLMTDYGFTFLVRSHILLITY